MGFALAPGFQISTLVKAPIGLDEEAQPRVESVSAGSFETLPLVPFQPSARIAEEVQSLPRKRVSLKGNLKFL